MAACPRIAAESKAVLPSLFVASTATPSLRMLLTTVTSPLAAAITRSSASDLHWAITHGSNKRSPRHRTTAAESCGLR